MAKRQLVRRWEPRFGVTRQMLEVEATYVAREKDDHLLRSIAELRDRLAHLRSLWKVADSVLEKAVAALPERERLAVSCLVARDLYMVLELHCTHLGKITAGEPAEKRPIPSASASTAELTKVPFCEWLFEDEEDSE